MIVFKLLKCLKRNFMAMFFPSVSVDADIALQSFPKSDDKGTYEAVFVSDIHLHPDKPDIEARFRAFIKWAVERTHHVYILGDFFHVWPGDDALDEWSTGIADQLAYLTQNGVKLYFIPGNRDFLIGRRFLERACMQKLSESSLIQLGKEKVLLVHGDRYCTKDLGHQWLRRLTRNRLFQTLFLCLPYRLRHGIVNQVREYSKTNKAKSMASMNVVPQALIKHLRRLSVNTVIHGHTHQPGLTTYGSYKQYVLSDWDEDPIVMCYNKSNMFYSDLFGG